MKKKEAPWEKEPHQPLKPKRAETVMEVMEQERVKETARANKGLVAESKAGAMNFKVVADK